MMSEIRTLTALHATATPEAFAAAYRRSLIKVQNCLGSHGIAPTASLDTETVERIRAAQMQGGS